MARPKNADPAQTRQRILDAAADELAQVGALDLSARNVARRAGVGVATVHGHFVDRRGLLDALIQRVYAKLAEGALAIRDEVRGARSPRETVEQTVRAGFRFACAHQNEVRALLLQTAAAGSLDSARQAAVQLPLLASLAAALAPELDVSAETVRMRFQSFLFAAARWSISSDDELRKLVGHTDEEECRRRVEDHLVELALSNFTR